MQNELTPDFLFTGLETAPVSIVLSHGAGAPMDSRFMTYFAKALADRGHRVVRFEFPYMAKRRTGGSRRPPDQAAALLATWRSVISAFDAKRLIIGGKSLGGRMASMVADCMHVRGLVCLGYPFHPPGKPAGARIAHLTHLYTPTLILQGSRDPFGTRDDVAAYPLSAAVAVHWLEDGDHGFKPRARSGRTEQQNWDEAVCAIEHFIARVMD